MIGHNGMLERYSRTVHESLKNGEVLREIAAKFLRGLLRGPIQSERPHLSVHIERGLAGHLAQRPPAYAPHELHLPQAHVRGYVSLTERCAYITLRFHVNHSVLVLTDPHFLAQLREVQLASMKVAVADGGQPQNKHE